MFQTLKGRWLVTLVLGYTAWVMAYNIEQYTMFVGQFNPVAHKVISLVAIFAVPAILTILFLLAVKSTTVLDGIALAIPWLIIHVVVDFILVSYYNGWILDFSGYGLSRAWHFLLVPLACVLSSIGALLLTQKKEHTFTPAHSILKFRK